MSVSCLRQREEENSRENQCIGSKGIEDWLVCANSKEAESSKWVVGRGGTLGGKSAHAYKSLSFQKLTVHSYAHHEESKDPGIGDKEEIVVVVVYTNAVVDPWTVMIEAFNTDIAD